MFFYFCLTEIFFVIIRAENWSNQKVSILLWSPRQIGWRFFLLFSASLHNEMLCFHESALIQTSRLCDRTFQPFLCLQAELNLTHPRLKGVSSRPCFKISRIFGIMRLNMHSFLPLLSNLNFLWQFQPISSHCGKEGPCSSYIFSNVRLASSLPYAKRVKLVLFEIHLISEHCWPQLLHISVTIVIVPQTQHISSFL